MARFIHTADWQIGMPFLNLNEEARISMKNARFDVIDTIAEYVSDQNGAIDFVLVTGDLFDDAQLGHTTIEHTVGAIAKIPCPVYVLAGNHEWRNSECIYASQVFQNLKPANMHVLEPGITTVSDVLEIASAPFEGKVHDHDLVAAQVRQLLPSEKLRIVAGHGVVDKFMDLGKADLIQFEPLKEAITAKIIDYVALGDRHSCLDVGGLGRIFYSGAPEPTDFNEDQNEVGLILDVTVEKGTTPIVRKQKVAKWKLDRIGKPTELFQIHSAEDLDELENLVKQIRKPRTTALKIYFESYLNIEQEIRRTALFDHWNGGALAGFAIGEHSAEPQVNTEDSDDLSTLGLSGYLEDAYKELAEIASGEEEEALDALKALAILRRLVKTS